ncbi:hypothetical protein FRACYDRAFT_222050 [Fragilariopsis cylindrus CCMP1102]|uniref:Ice-binding protein n=1 Tax=Fragilariopsis cylindrus CCMP1102 TaxID=635003 RepID=A0A1E7EKW9_9STRA|nr:hypothetical protein FRACYDRAFT_222050 [Fragilariopsis cylindrus CCMP1102]|eukprot:OEU06569.1 hypothetical protein FRACYDRAFT_222050 [Fragilariopsis cylindrus CCMP1102]
MNLNLFLLSVIAMVNAASGTTTKVNLGTTASNFVILAKTGISTVPSSIITGNIAVSPIASTAITGFSLIIDSSNEFSTSSQVADTYTVKASDYTNGSELITAVNEMEAAYTDAAARPTSDDDDAFLNLGGGEIGGETLKTGVYTFDRDVTITGGDLTFDGEGNSDAVFIIQTSKSVSQAGNTRVILAGGAKAENIFWSVAGAASVAAGSHSEGIFLVKKGVTFITGSSLNGRIFSQTAVTLQMATITETPYTQIRRGLRGLQVA